MSNIFKALKAVKPADTHSLEAQAAGYVTDDNTGGYYVVGCQECGAIYPSQQSSGGGQIADTGDYDDSSCPHCGQVDPDECDNVGLTWNVQQAKINTLLSMLEEKDQQLACYSVSPGQSDQRLCESRAVRDELGFGKDADDVSPMDLRNAIKAIKQRAESAEHQIISLFERLSGEQISNYSAGTVKWLADIIEGELDASSGALIAMRVRAETAEQQIQQLMPGTLIESVCHTRGDVEVAMNLIASKPTPVALENETKTIWKLPSQPPDVSRGCNLKVWGLVVVYRYLQHWGAINANGQAESILTLDKVERQVIEIYYGSTGATPAELTEFEQSGQWPKNSPRWLENYVNEDGDFLGVTGFFRENNDEGLVRCNTFDPDSNGKLSIKHSFFARHEEPAFELLGWTELSRPHVSDSFPE